MVSSTISNTKDLRREKVKTESALFDVDEYEGFFGKNENFDSVDDLRKRIDKEKLDLQKNSNKRVYLTNNFIFEENEVLETLKMAGIYKIGGKRLIAYTIIMIVTAISFFLFGIYGKNYSWLFFGFLSLVVMVAMWIVPIFHLKKLAYEKTTGETVRMRITDEDITQKIGDKEWIILLDGTGTLECGQNVLVIRTYHGQMFAIPKRSIGEEIYKEILQIIKNGTKPYER